MRYNLIADNDVEAEVLESHAGMKPLFDPFLPVIQARALMAAVDFGIFDAIGHESRSAEGIADALELDAETLEMILRVLVCAGYVASNEGLYELTETTRTTLLSGSPGSLTFWVKYNYTHWELISHLEEVLRTGKGGEGHRLLKSRESWAVYQNAMLETARPAAQWIAGHIPVADGATKLLDIGGSHGLYGAMICRAHPPLQSEVLELPEALEHAMKLAHDEGIDDIVSHRAGDAIQEDFGLQTLDVAFLGNITHHFSAEQNLDLFRRIRSALRREGTLAIWDFKRPDADSRPDLVSDGLALLFRIGSATRCYSSEEYIEWMKAAGFVEILIHATPAPAQILITGRTL
jgi:hypothetical protein